MAEDVAAVAKTSIQSTPSDARVASTASQKASWRGWFIVQHV